MTAKEFLNEHGIPNMPTQYSPQFQTDVNDTAKALEEYHKAKLKLLGIGGVGKRFSINEKVIWDGMYYWVLEINEGARKILLANDRNQDHPQYNDWWVNVDEVNAC